MRSREAAIVACALAGCLPEGGPGAGRQVVAGRGLADVSFSRERGDGPGGFLLFTRASAGEDAAANRDLYLIGRDGGPARLRAERLPESVRGSYFWDGGGRLYLHRDLQRGSPPTPDQPGVVNWELVSVDPVEGDQVSLGRSRLERMSPSRERLFYQRPDGSGRLRGLIDRSERPVGAAIRQSLFVGEDLYLIDDRSLVRLPAAAEATQVLLDEVTAFRPVATSEGDLVVRRPVAGSTDEGLALVRLTGDAALASSITQARLVGDPSVSLDGHWLAWVSGPIRVAGWDAFWLSLRDLVSGRESRSGFVAESVRLPPGTDIGEEPAPPRVDIAHRPGVGQAWFTVSFRLFVVGAGAGVEVFSGNPGATRIGPSRAGERLGDDQPAAGRRPRSSLFTGDGRRWIFDGADARIHLGDADDPQSTAGVAVSTIAAGNDLLELEQGRRLAVWLEPGDGRADLYVLDLPEDQLRFLAQDVGATLFGAHRVLAIARKVGDRRATGDLVLVDLDSGAEVLLAHNVSEFAVPAACSGCDPTAPGTPFAYVVQARVPWPYEGLWTGELP
jgi:hypothetical protein